MKNSINPFDALYSELSEIKNLLLQQVNRKPIEQEPKPDFPYIPIQDIFKKKICSKPTFYDHLKKGHFTLYKFGNKSFVDSEEFQKAFHCVKLNEVIPCIKAKINNKDNKF